MQFHSTSHELDVSQNIRPKQEHLIIDVDFCVTTDLIIKQIGSFIRIIKKTIEPKIILTLMEIDKVSLHYIRELNLNNIISYLNAIFFFVTEYTLPWKFDLMN